MYVQPISIVLLLSLIHTCWCPDKRNRLELYIGYCIIMCVFILNVVNYQYNCLNKVPYQVGVLPLCHHLLTGTGNRMTTQSPGWKHLFCAYQVIWCFWSLHSFPCTCLTMLPSCSHKNNTWDHWLVALLFSLPLSPFIVSNRPCIGWPCANSNGTKSVDTCGTSQYVNKKYGSSLSLFFPLIGINLRVLLKHCIWCHQFGNGRRGLNGLDMECCKFSISFSSCNVKLVHWSNRMFPVQLTSLHRYISQ